MAAEHARPKDPNSKELTERFIPMLLADHYSGPSSAVMAKMDLSQTDRDISLPNNIDTTTESSVHSSSGPDPAPNQPLVMSEINEDPSQLHYPQVSQEPAEYRPRVTEHQQIQIMPSSAASYKDNVPRPNSYPHHQLLYRWLYETCGERMTMAEILEKANWEKQRLERL